MGVKEKREGAVIVVLSYFCFVASSVHGVGQSVFLCSVSCLELELPINSLFLQMNGADCVLTSFSSLEIVDLAWPSTSSLDEANAIPVYGHLCLTLHDVRGKLRALSCVPGSMESICCVEQIFGLHVLGRFMDFISKMMMLGNLGYVKYAEDSNPFKTSVR
ncbi:hypothetical protein Prudu_023031 [Prunus dulcis]|uniref:Uncharacterized protein n=1 Tax=Prunus dulcis TaxID=3755 RepID=A0A4Y1S2B7_PRUDU|nr:hypothetical protein Prudu_023031 [Prunus dulcis]